MAIPKDLARQRDELVPNYVGMNKSNVFTYDKGSAVAWKLGFNHCAKLILESDEHRDIIDYVKRTSGFLNLAITILDKANSNPGYAIALRDFNMIIQPIIGAESKALTNWQAYIGEK